MPAIKWENNIMGFVPKKDWLDIPFNPTRQSDPIDGLFGDQKTDNLVAEWESIASEYQIPVMAQFHGFDTEAQTTFRVPIDNHNIEKGLIKVKINQSERMRALLRSGVQNDQMYDYVIRDGVRLGEQVITRTKVAKNELMATGKITIKENNLDLTVDYGVPAIQTAFKLDFSEGADIPAQLQDIIDSALQSGVTLTGILTSKKNITKMRKNEFIQKAIYGTYGTGTLVRRSELDSYLDEEFGISTVITNDLTYGAKQTIGSDGRPNIITERYYPDDKISFFATNAGGRMGIGLWGDAPEVDAGQFMSVGTAQQNPYVTISQWMEKDPAVLWTKASSLFMPVLYNPNSLWIATVTDGDKLPDLTLKGVTSGTMFEVPIGDIQENVTVDGDEVHGTLKFLEGDNAITNVWGDGNFFAFDLSDNNFTGLTSVKVGVVPSAGSGLVEIISDPDKNGIAKISDKNVQKFRIVQTNGTVTKTQDYDLNELTVEGK